MGINQYWAVKVYDLCVYFMTGTPEGSTESGFMEKHFFLFFWRAFIGKSIVRRGLEYQYIMRFLNSVKTMYARNIRFIGPDSPGVNTLSPEPSPKPNTALDCLNYEFES